MFSLQDKAGENKTEPNSQTPFPTKINGDEASKHICALLLFAYENQKQKSKPSIELSGLFNSEHNFLYKLPPIF